MYIVKKKNWKEEIIDRVNDCVRNKEKKNKLCVWGK
jgi:hypothetical protein